jgi:hypothetical protein
VQSRELLSWFIDGIIDGLVNGVGFVLPIVSCGEHYPDSPGTFALRIDMPTDRVLADAKRTVL